MAKQCRTPYWSPHLNTVDECRNSATRTCSQCRATLCWQHIKQRCPSGKRNRYGVMQHLTRPHAEELRMANRLTMRSIRAVKETHSHDSALVVITFSYLNGEGLERQFQAYPGAIRQAEGEYQWIPDEGLSQWLVKMTKGRTMGWDEPADCVNELHEIINAAA